MTSKNMNIPQDIFHFETVMRVRSTEIDMGQQLRTESLAGMFSEARARFLYAHGIREIDPEYFGILVTDMQIDFTSRARAREELLFEVGVYNQNKYGGDMGIRVTRMSDMSQVGIGKFGFVCYNYIENKVSLMTDTIKELFNNENDNFPL